MTHKFLIFFAVFGSFCAGQSASTAPAPGLVAAPSVASPGPEPGVVQVPSVTTPSLSASTPESGRGTTPADSTSTHTETIAAPTRVFGPLTARSEFELFAEDAAGSPLPVYGRQLFNQAPTTFAPMDRIPVPADYVIGPERPNILTEDRNPERSRVALRTTRKLSPSRYRQSLQGL